MRSKAARALGLACLLGVLVGGGLAVLWPAEPSEAADGGVAIPPAIVASHPGAAAARPVDRTAKAKPAVAAAARHADADDLWAQAAVALASGNPHAQITGLFAARECLGLVGGQDDMLARMWGADNAGRRQLALQALLQRCRGFSQAGRMRSMQLVEQLADRVHRSPDGAAMTRIAAPKPAAIVAAIRSGEAVALELGLIKMTGYWSRQHDHTAQDDEGLKFTFAALLAACDLGKPCGPDSWGALLQCIQDGVCDADLWSAQVAQYSAQERADVERYRQHIVDAVKAGEWAQLGLPPTL